MMSKKKKQLSVKIFIGWLCLILLTEITFFLSTKGLFEAYHIYYEILCYTHILHGPILFFYILSFIHENLKLRKKDLLHLIPIIIYVGYKTTIKSLDLVDCLDDKGCFKSDNIYSVISVLMKLFILLGYVVLSKRLINGIKNDKLLNIRTNLNSYNWLNSITQGVIVLISIVILIEVLFILKVPFAIDKTRLVNIIVTLFIISFVYIWNRYAYIFARPFEGVNNNSDQTEKYKDGLADDILIEHYNQIVGYLEKTEAFTDNDLTLKKLSGLTGISEKDISQVINRKTESSYSDFINSYRVKLFIKKLEDNEHKQKTLLSLAYDCGFNSKSTFNRAFKQIIGATPSEYLKEKE